MTLRTWITGVILTVCTYVAIFVPNLLASSNPPNPRGAAGTILFAIAMGMGIVCGFWATFPRVR